MNKSTKNSVTLVLICLLSVLAAVIYTENVNEPLNRGYECRLSDQMCSFDGELGSLSVTFEQPPEIEEELVIDFYFSSNILLKRAWVEGSNMYMGRTPVVPENSTDGAFKLNSIDALNSFKGVIFLGSCTEPLMQWNLYIEMENIATEDTRTYRISFDTNSL